MRKLIRKILKEEGEKVRALTPTEIHLFRLLNKENAIKYGDKRLNDRVKDLLETLGKKDANAKYYTALYKANYRDAGDYQNLKKDELVDPRKFYPHKTTNVTSSEYSTAKMQFKGSNLEGYWSKDNNGVEFYAITSYNWYPIYLFKQNVWYEVTNTYSSSTAKQMRYSNPVKYNIEIGRDMIMVTAEEMLKLIRNATYEDIMKGKVQKLINDKNKYLSSKTKFSSTGKEGFPENPPIKIRFKITDITEENGKAVIEVTVDDAGKRDGNKFVPSNGGYLKGEVPGASKENIENRIRRDIIRNFDDYIGTSSWAYSDDMTHDKNNIRFKFIHSHENS